VGGGVGCIVLSGFLLLNAEPCTAHMLLHLMRWDSKGRQGESNKFSCLC
jgi:hypothetical protein